MGLAAVDHGVFKGYQRRNMLMNNRHLITFVCFLFAVYGEVMMSLAEPFCIFPVKMEFCRKSVCSELLSRLVMCEFV